MADHTESELLSCPFCGRQPAICVLEDEPGGSPFGYWLNCLCGAQTQERRTEAEAVEAWNRRVLPTPATEGQPQPVAWRYCWYYKDGSTKPKVGDDGRCEPLYASPPSPELREALIAAARNWFCECNPKGTDEKQLAVAVARAFPEDCQGKDTCTCGESDGCEECMTTAEIEARICQWESELAQEALEKDA